jgi:hypothetical protein
MKLAATIIVANRTNRTHSAPSRGKRVTKSVLAQASPLATTQNIKATKARAITAYQKLGNVGAVCAAAGVARRTWYDWIANDPTFALELDDARENTADELESIAYKRAKAKNGERLVMFLLKALRPHKFRDAYKIDVVSPLVKEKVRQTVAVIRAELPKEFADKVLLRLNVVWQ